MSEEFCDGVKILLKRMESNPEEFKVGNSRWQHVLHTAEGSYPDWSNALTPAEIEALKDGIRKIARDMFTETVMSILLEDKEEVLQGQFRITERHTSGWTDPRSLAVFGGGGGGTIGTGLTYPTLSPFAESQPPSSGEILARTKKFLGLK
jgi:hypothetical protein